jgi:beta-galactosidase/beta-glucuronidase
VASATVFGKSALGGAVRLDVVDSATEETVASRTVAMVSALDSATGWVTVTATIPAAKLKMWSPESPSLFNATLSLLSTCSRSGIIDNVNNDAATDADDNTAVGAAIDSIQTRFGVKDLRIVGPHFVLNGKKLFLSGFGADAPYADTIAAPSDKAYHLRQARTAKSFGFNFARCHR